MIAGFHLYIASCTTSSSMTEEQENQEESEFEDDLDGEIEDTYPHPRAANAWETKVLILTSKTPAKKALNDCEAEIRALAADSGNDIRLQQVRKSLTNIVKGNPDLYHWCFYWMARNLDLGVEYLGSSIDRKIDIFYSGMSALWPLSQSLDQTRDVDIYFRYLRSRYIEISSKIFGRPLEIVTEPLGSADSPPSQASFTNEASPIGKPAGPVDLN